MVSYTVKHLTERLGVTKSMVEAAIKRGDLHVQRFGGRSIHIEPAEAEAFIAAIEAARALAPDPGRKRGSYCQAMLGSRCFCACHTVSRTRLDRRRPRVGWRVWTVEHDVALRELVEQGLSPEQIAPVLSERFPTQRSRHGVERRITKLGLSTRDGWVSGEDLIRDLGVYRRRIEQWESQGLLTRAQYGHWRRYPLPMIDDLIRSQAGITIDPRRIRNPQWRTLAETAAIVNRRKQAS